jgi:ubiquinone/menaquinone biosynthesis C-methylase UbiE
VNLKEKKLTIARYNETLKTFGYDPRTLGWLNGNQEVRFEALTQIADLKNSTVLDIGCGFGDLYAFLVKKGIKVGYTGYDINPNLLKVAKDMHPAAKFELLDATGNLPAVRYDWVFESGMFNYKLANNIGFIKKALGNMYALCKKGMAADFMTSYVDFKKETLYYADPKEIFEFCKTLSRRVTLRHEYMPFEFCIYVFKNDSVNRSMVFTDFNALSRPRRLTNMSAATRQASGRKRA